MARVQKFSSQLIDYAERLSDMADAAEGKHHGGVKARWLLLPASGAALYALVRSDAFSRQAKDVAEDAKSRATELPSDLLKRVRQTAGKATSGPNGSSSRSSSSSSGSRSRSSSSRRSSSRRRTKAAA